MIDVLLFAKAPVAGTVKTRLAADVGEESALQLYRDMGERLVRDISPVSRLTVWFDPPDALLAMQAWLGARDYRPQPAGDLGARLSAAFSDHFSRRPGQPALAIGVDTPEVSADTLEDAARAFDHARVVIGPALDGGYYLIGLAAPRQELFAHIPWGTSEVFAATQTACRRLKISPILLPTLRDVDTVDDAKAVGLWPRAPQNGKADIGHA